jgi:hypothetical protein
VRGLEGTSAASHLTFKRRKIAVVVIIMAI